MKLKEIELLRELTIVIPTYNRPLELERAIEYWRDTPVTVHILDGSEKPWLPVGVLYGVPNITYHYFEPKKNDSLLTGYKNRIRFATELPNTRFAAMIGEDDFFTISGLNASLKLLNEDIVIGSVTGISVGYEKAGSKILMGLRQVEKKDLKRFESLSVTDRLNSSFMPIVYYGIFQTEIWKKTFALSFQYDFQSNLLGGERLVHANALALAPLKEMNQILWFRRFYVERVNFEIFEQKRGDYERYLANDLNKREVDNLFGSLSSAIQLGNPNFNEKQALSLSMKVLKPGFRSSEDGFKYRLRKKLAGFLVRLGTVVPPGLRLFLNRSMSNKITKSLGFVEVDQKLKPTLGRQDLSTFLKELAHSGIEYDESEIRNVNELLLKPREELRLRANI